MLVLEGIARRLLRVCFRLQFQKLGDQIYKTLPLNISSHRLVTALHANFAFRFYIAQ